MGGSAMICRDCCVSASCRGELNTEETETDREEDNRGKEGRPDRMDGPRQSRRHRQAEGDVVPPLIEITHRYGKRTGGCGCGCSCSCSCNCGETGPQVKAVFSVAPTAGITSSPQQQQQHASQKQEQAELLVPIRVLSILIESQSWSTYGPGLCDNYSYKYSSHLFLLLGGRGLSGGWGRGCRRRRGLRGRPHELQMPRESKKEPEPEQGIDCTQQQQQQQQRRRQ